MRREYSFSCLTCPFYVDMGDDCHMCGGAKYGYMPEVFDKRLVDDEDKMEKEKVLEVEFQDVFDNMVAWKIIYQNKDILNKVKLEDGSGRLGFTSLENKGVCLSSCVLHNAGEIGNSGIGMVSKEVAEKFKNVIRKVNDEYGIPKRWRANKGERYFYIAGSGYIGCAVDDYIGVDDDRYKFGNYFKTKEKAQVKLDKIKPIFKED